MIAPGSSEWSVWPWKAADRSSSADKSSVALVFPACNPLRMPRLHKPRWPPSKACWLSKADRIARSYGKRPYAFPRSEEHTSELQSLMRISYAVFCLKKKKITDRKRHTQHKHQVYMI